MDRKKNIGYLDILRVSAAFTVVLLHVISSSRFHLETALDPATDAALRAVRVLLNWCVPVFVMITGYIFLGTEKACDYPQVKKYILRFLGALATFGLGYAVMERIYWEKAFTLRLLLEAVGDVFTGNLWEHMWYVYEILGIYLILPILKPFCEKGVRHLVWGCGVTFLFCLLVPCAEDILEKSGMEVTIAFRIPLTRYLFYLFAGGLFAAAGKTKRKVLPAALWLCLWSAALLVFGHLGLNTGFLSLPAAGMTLAVFHLTRLLFENRPVSRWWRHLASAAWGIYLIHPLFLNVLFKLLKLNPLDGWAAVTVPATAAGVFGLSWGAVWLLKKLPVFRKILA